MKTKVFLKPSEHLLSKMMGMHATIDALIVHDCFMHNNPMREETGEPIVWDWAVLEIGGVRMPMPYHTHDATTSYLFTHDGEEVRMSNEECVKTLAVFYLSNLLGVVRFMNDNLEQVHPMIVSALSGGDAFINKHGADKIVDWITNLKNELGVPALRVLD